MPTLTDFYRTNFPMLLPESCTEAAATWKLFISCTGQVNARKQKLTAFKILHRHSKSQSYFFFKILITISHFLNL